METSKKPESFIRKKNFIIIKSTRVWWMFLADVPRPWKYLIFTFGFLVFGQEWVISF